MLMFILGYVSCVLTVSIILIFLTGCKEPPTMSDYDYVNLGLEPFDYEHPLFDGLCFWNHPLRIKNIPYNETQKFKLKGEPL